MGSEGWSDEIEQRRRVGELTAGEVSVAHEASVLLVPAHARPVVEALEREMDVFVGFELEDGETTVKSAGEHVDHGAVGGGEGGHLRVHEATVETLVDGADVAGNERFQPALGTQAEEGVAAL